MKFTLLGVIMLFLSVTAAEKKDEDLATRVIESKLVDPIYNGANDSEEEAIKSTLSSSDYMLQKLMLQESTDQRMKICYALEILKRQILETHWAISVSGTNSSSSKAHLVALQDRQRELARQLISLQRTQPKSSEETNATPPKNFDTGKGK